MGGRVLESLLFAMFVLGVIMLFVTIPVIGGQLARGEMSPFPWDQFISEQRRHGFWDATLSVLMLLTFHLWAFLIPARMYTTIVAEKKGRSPWYPYVINILVGLLLSTPHNPLYSLIKIGGPAGGDY